MKSKPEKPTPDFPLFAHASGKWAKKIGGKLHYFGRWDDPDGAIAEYQALVQRGGKAKAKAGRKAASNGKPAKPYAAYPLFAHASGQWAKKIDGSTRYFGAWSDPDGALQRYLNERTAWETGQTPAFVDGVTVKQLCDLFLENREEKVQAGEMRQLTWDDYKAECERIVRVLGRHTIVKNLMPRDFGKLRADCAKGKGGRVLSPVSRKCFIQRIRAVFNWGYDNGTIAQPVRWGTEFDQPKKRELRIARNERGSAKFQPAEIRTLLDLATPQMKAMILLGINCGFGNRDCAFLTTRYIDIDGGWHDYPRQKTASRRRAWLWPQTCEAIRDILRTPKEIAAELGIATKSLYPSPEAIDHMGVVSTNSVAKLIRKHPAAGVKDACGVWQIYGWAIVDYLQAKLRPEATDDEAKGLIFRTKDGQPWIKYYENGEKRGYNKDSIAMEFAKLVKKSKIDCEGRDLTFYSLRHTFQTVGDESGHPVAVKSMMGHADNDFDISTVYREELSDDVLRGVCEHIRRWLFG